ncbi:MAG: septum formation inhibitor Maf, partial [Planctomycetota bacterium]
MQRWWMLVLVAGVGLGLGLAATGGGGSVTGNGAAADELWMPPAYGEDFGAVWYDGRAEMASYRLTYPRYGELREGTAVAVTVTEPFNGEQRVKADAVGDETYGVLKLNLMEDFPTGVYEYNLMTSVF